MPNVINAKWDVTSNGKEWWMEMISKVMKIVIIYICLYDNGKQWRSEIMSRVINIKWYI
jgi:hypothetical protein